jgi:hypothetical protein
VTILVITTITACCFVIFAAGFILGIISANTPPNPESS